MPLKKETKKPDLFLRDNFTQSLKNRGAYTDVFPNKLF